MAQSPEQATFTSEITGPILAIYDLCEKSLRLFTCLFGYLYNQNKYNLECNTQGARFFFTLIYKYIYTAKF